jgi:hypothetical protein
VHRIAEGGKVVVVNPFMQQSLQESLPSHGLLSSGGAYVYLDRPLESTLAMNLIDDLSAPISAVRAGHLAQHHLLRRDQKLVAQKSNQTLRSSLQGLQRATATETVVASPSPSHNVLQLRQHSLQGHCIEPRSVENAKLVRSKLYHPRALPAWILVS